MLAPQPQAITAHQQRVLDALVDAWTRPASPYNPGATTLQAVAAKLGISLADLLDEVATPSLAAALASLRDLAHLESTVHAVTARRVALDTLAAIAADEENDPIERRRASSSILRATATPRARRRADEVPPRAERSPLHHLNESHSQRTDAMTEPAPEAQQPDDAVTAPTPSAGPTQVDVDASTKETPKQDPRSARDLGSPGEPLDQNTPTHHDDPSPALIPRTSSTRRPNPAALAGSTGFR